MNPRKRDVAVAALNKRCDQCPSLVRAVDWEDNLGLLLTAAGHEVWGSVSLTYNADNFGPWPSYFCTLYGVWGFKATGFGHTAEEAILRAVAHRETLGTKGMMGEPVNFEEDKPV